MILLPRPKALTFETGFFPITPYTRLVLQASTQCRQKDAALVEGLSQLKQEIVCATGIETAILRGSGQAGDICVLVQDNDDSEAYRLSIAPEGVQITGGLRGAFWGLQTLRQVVRQSGVNLPALSVEDAPAFAHRGFYHDVTRGRTPTLEWLKHLADEACFYKLNQLQLYVEHSFLFNELTEIWDIAQPLTAQDIMLFDDYCAKRQIELVPSMSSFGHLFELLNTQSYNELCELEAAGRMPSTMPHRMRHHTLNIADPRGFALVEKMLREYLPLFRSRRFNICADETFDLGKGRGKAAMEAAGEGRYYIDYVRKLCTLVEALGSTPMFWGDVVVQHQQALEALPKGTICLNWGYSADETEDSTRILAQAGAQQYVCPGVQGWNRWMNRIPHSYENISRMAAYGHRYGAAGLLNTDWGDFGHINDPRFSLPGMIIGAHFSWSEQKVPFDVMMQDISRLAYSDRSGRAVGLLAQLQDLDVCDWWHLVEHRDHTIGHGEPTCTDEFGQLDLSGVEEAERRISLIEQELRECTMAMDTAQRSILPCWLNACEAIRLWNLTGAAVQAGRRDAALAERLERWLYNYEKLWHQVSRESELWRIRDMVRWYAKQLRTQ